MGVITIILELPASSADSQLCLPVLGLGRGFPDMRSRYKESRDRASFRFCYKYYWSRVDACWGLSYPRQLCLVNFAAVPYFQPNNRHANRARLPKADTACLLTFQRREQEEGSLCPSIQGGGFVYWDNKLSQAATESFI